MPFVHGKKPGQPDTRAMVIIISLGKTLRDVRSDRRTMTASAKNYWDRRVNGSSKGCFVGEFARVIKETTVYQGEQRE